MEKIAPNGEFVFVYCVRWSRGRSGHDRNRAISGTRSSAAPEDDGGEEVLFDVLRHIRDPEAVEPDVWDG